MAKLSARTEPKNETRTETVLIDNLGELQLDDRVVGKEIAPWAAPIKVERTVHEKVEGSVTLELSETEARVLKALLGKVNGHGEAELRSAAHAVFDELVKTKLRGEYIEVSVSTEYGAIELSYGTDDRIFG